MIDISTKKIEECEFTKGKEVIYINGNSSNEYLIIVLKNGKIYALDSNRNVKFFKNLIVNSVFIESKGTLENLRMFCSQNLDKMVISNDNFITIWYKSESLPLSNSKQNSKKRNSFSGIIKRQEIEEINGKFYNISLENEKSLIFKNNKAKNQYQSINNTLSGRTIYESVIANFGNNYFLGSFGRIVYSIFSPTEIYNSYKLVLIDYTFKYEKIDKVRKNYGSPNDDSISYEYLKNIEKRTLYSHFTYSYELSKENIQYTPGKDRIIMKFNSSSNTLAIMINSEHAINSILTLYFTETSKFSSLKLFDLWSRVKPPKNEASKMFVWVEDLDFFSNDMFIILVFSQGYFLIMNIDFSIISFLDISKSTICSMNSSISNLELLSCPTYIYNQKLKLSDKLSCLTSKKRTDYFAIYNKDFCICFLVNSKNYETRMLVPTGGESFVDFLYLLKFYQMYANENDGGVLFDNIHNFMVKFFKELYNPENEQTMPNDNVGHIFNIFVKFIRIFRSLDLIHETNLTILSYLIGVTNDFFYHLINYKEIWLAYLFVEICENYLLKNLKIKVSKNKVLDDPLIKSQTSFCAFNPYHLQNTSLKCFNKINNKVLHSRLRLILLFFALIEFRNNQALNINVLYFILAKNCIEKIRKSNLLDDVQTIVKVIIRNWKYLKNENSRAGGEEYILSSLTMNYKTEYLANLMLPKNPREDIKFEFFSDFLPLEGLNDFFELHEAYCRGDEESLVNEYNYINNIGIVQRWILFFSNYFHNFLFEDIKNYITNHLKQTVSQNKKIENISPEETNLSSLIYFNVTFFFLTLCHHLKFFMKQFKLNSDDSSIFYNFNKIQMPFISPVDVPFIIFEFYTIEDNKLRKNIGYEINQNLDGLISNYLKCLNYTVNDTFDLLDFFIETGFKCDIDICEDAPIGNKFQNYLFTSTSVYFYLIHKFNMLHILDSDTNMLLEIIDSLQVEYKYELYGLIFIIVNGHLRFYLQKENQSKLNFNLTKYLELVFGFIKIIFYKLLREETFSVRKKIYDYILISPNVLRPYLIEGAYYYEYKNFNNLVKSRLFNHKNLLNITNYLNISNTKLPNLFDDLLSSTCQTNLFHSIFTCEETNSEEIKNFHKNYVIAVDNLIKLCKFNQSVLFNLETDIELIKKAIINLLKDKKNDEVLNHDFISSVVDKLVKCSLETHRKEFKFSSNDHRVIITRSLKLSYLKIIHLLNLILVKYKSFFCLNPQKETLNYLKIVAYSLVFTDDEMNEINTSKLILDYLLNVRVKTEAERNIVLEIIRFLAIVYLKKGHKLSNEKIYLKLEEMYMKSDEALASKLKIILTEEIPYIETIYQNLAFLNSKNLRNSFVLLFTDFYWENMLNVVKTIGEYISQQGEEAPLNNSRRSYVKMAECFSELTGIPSKNFIEFNENWGLSSDESLFKFIVSDEYEEISVAEPHANLVMNRRQRYGADTPRKKINAYKDKETENYLNDSNRSIKIREEKEECEKSKIVLKNKHQGSYLPPKSKNVRQNANLGSADKNDEIKSVNTILKKDHDELDNISSNTVINKGNTNNIGDRNENHQIIENSKNLDSNESKIENLIKIINKCMFNKLKNAIFLKFKENSHLVELDEIKIYSVKPLEGKYDVLILKEKYVPNKELEYKSARANNISLQNSSYISDNKSNHRRNDSVCSGVSNKEKNQLNIKPFDIININKFKSGKGDKSGLLKDLLNSKSRKDMQNTIKNKISEIQEKLRIYEEMAISLGKEFTNTFNK